MKIFFTLITIALVSTLNAQEFSNSKNGMAVKGFDVVSYFSNEAIKGTDQFVVEYKGDTYHFSSEENLETFITNPEMFLPQYGGFCAYAVAIKGEKIDINPKSFQIIDHKLYLFYDNWGVDTLKKWNEEGAEKLQKQADVNWGKITKKEK